MTAKEFVKTSLPNARAEKHRTNGGINYWLIRDGGNTMYMASGNTQAEAWKNAKWAIENRANFGKSLSN